MKFGQRSLSLILNSNKVLRKIDNKIKVCFLSAISNFDETNTYKNASSTTRRSSETIEITRDNPKTAVIRRHEA